MKLTKLRSIKFCRGGFMELRSESSNSSKTSDKWSSCCSEIKWEVRPGGMLVQTRDYKSKDEEVVTIRVSTVTQFHDISIEATSTFKDLKMVLSLITRMEPNAQRLLFKGKERGDDDHLHIVGVRDKDRMFLLEDPAMKEMKHHETQSIAIAAS